MPPHTPKIILNSEWEDCIPNLPQEEPLQQTIPSTKPQNTTPPFVISLVKYSILLLAFFTILATIRYYISSEWNNCMKEYIRKGWEYGTLYRFGNDNHIEHINSSLNLKWERAVWQANGCVMLYYWDIVSTVTNTIYCQTAKVLISNLF